MPIPSEIEVLRLQVIAQNNQRLQDALHHENSVYVLVGKKLRKTEAYLYRLQASPSQRSSRGRWSQSDFV